MGDLEKYLTGRKNGVVQFAAAFFLFFLSTSVFSQPMQGHRDHLLMDSGWRFAFGHPYDTEKDFNNGTAYFSYFSKAGFGDGAAAVNFDDRTWRKLDLPHDWAAEQPFDKAGSFSHGFKAIGRNFPNASIGWYRKKIMVPSGDLNRRISIAFDGVFRNSMVWVNGHYLGTQQSGYLGFEYDISAYINYGAENTIAVRVDATMEEGWFYEGAGIYRHVWLNKTDPLHVATSGTNITANIADHAATVNIATTINNDAATTQPFSITQTIIDAAGKIIASKNIDALHVAAYNSNTFNCSIHVNDPKLWDIENPYLYTLKTTVQKGTTITDEYFSTFGIRSIRFDNNKGFFLNGKHIKINLPSSLLHYKMDKWHWCCPGMPADSYRHCPSSNYLPPLFLQIVLFAQE